MQTYRLLVPDNGKNLGSEQMNPMIDKKRLLDLLVSRANYGSDIGHKVLPIYKNDLDYLILLLTKDMEADLAQ